MTLLGISFAIDSGAALVDGGTVVAAVNEERLSRKKFQSGFPRRSVAEVLRLAGNPRVDRVLLASTTWSAPIDLDDQSFDVPDFQQRALALAGRTGLQRLALGNPAGVGVFRAVFGALLRARLPAFRRTLQEMGVCAPISAVDHHRAHAAAAAFTSGWDDALVVTADGLGDGLCASVYAKRGPRLDLLAEVPCFHSLGIFYTYVTHMMGFKFGREGKVTGLAAHGDPRAALPIFERYVTFDPDSGGIRNHARGIGADYEALKHDLQPFCREDVAAAVQAHFENSLSAFAGHHLRRTGLRRLALAGGVFANVRVNQVLRELPDVDALWIYPHMGDGGGAAGAALSAYYADAELPAADQATRRLSSLYLGPAFEGSDVDLALLGLDGVDVLTTDDPETEAARLLAEGRVVARVSGPMEYGPRALGNRSVLFHAGDRTVNDWLNRKLRRTEFMPFAPVILEDEAPLWLLGWEPDHLAARYMTVTYRATRRCAELAPAVVHVDGTLRPQVLSAEDNPAFHRLLVEYRRRTGLGILLNTSFNLHEEPIVCSPADAVRAFRQAGLDALVFQDRVVTRVSTPETAEGSGNVSALDGFVGRYLDPARVLAPSPVTFLRVAGSLVSARRRGESASLPSAAGIDVSDACNLACQHCSRVIHRDARRVSLPSLADFRAFFDAMHPRYVLLAGYGEPLLNPELPAMVAWARRKGCEVGVVTNGTLLEPKLAEALVKSGLSKLKVSVEAVNPELYARLRTGARLEEVLRNVERFRALAGRRVAVEFQLVIFEENRGQIAPLIRLCRDRFPGVQPHFFYLFTYGGQEGFTAKALRFGDPDTLSEVDEGIALAQSSGFPRAVDSLRLVRAQLTTDLSRAPCIVPWVSCLVSTDGDLYPCCHHSVHGRPLGNLKQASFADLWNGPAMRAFRVALARDRSADPVCARCGFHDAPVWRLLHPLSGV